MRQNSALNKIKKNFQGFCKDPLFCLGIFLAVFLLLQPFFTADKKLSKIDEAVPQKDWQKLFIEPVKNFLGESPEMVLIGKNSVLAIASPETVNPQVLAFSGEAEEDPADKKEIVEYEVEQGDTISSIADNFGISVNTILWANNLSKNSVLKLGQKLIIPPISGVLYFVKSNDTLSQIAKTYKGNLEEIIAFNELSNENDIFVGDILIIPNGAMPVSQKSYYAETQVPLGTSYFICPHSSCRITQGLHWYNAIDFGGNCGDPIYAAAAGVVQKVKFGWNAGAGNYLTILHPNGVITNYGHISVALAKPGQEVSQGDMIALMGGKPGTVGAGKSTGCHVHFDVKGARNPFAK